MSDQDDTKTGGRFSSSGFFVRLLIAVTLPIALVGAGLWWTVGNDRIDRTIDLRAIDQYELLNQVLDGNLGLGSNATVEVLDSEAIAANLNSFESLWGEHSVVITRPDGTVIFSTDELVEVGEVRSLDPIDRVALQGVPSGAQVSSSAGYRMKYVVPWAPEAGPTSAFVTLTVADDDAIAVTERDARRLGILFAGAFLALLIALIPLCWWSLGAVRRQFRKTRQLAITDNLTGLANRGQFHDRLEEAVAGADRGRGKVGLLMLDLDGFKAINDTGGHAAGDRLLKRVSASLESSTRRNELSCRLGGDEFAVVVPRLSGRDELVNLAERLHDRLDMHVEFTDGRSLRITASIGLAMFPDDAPTAEDLVNVADIAMYKVKAARVAQLPPGARSRKLIR